jgi:hypothetical protein
MSNPPPKPTACLGWSFTKSIYYRQRSSCRNYRRGRALSDVYRSAECIIFVRDIPVKNEIAKLVAQSPVIAFQTVTVASLLTQRPVTSMPCLFIYIDSQCPATDEKCTNEFTTPGGHMLLEDLLVIVQLAWCRPQWFSSSSSYLEQTSLTFLD